MALPTLVSRIQTSFQSIESAPLETILADVRDIRRLFYQLPRPQYSPDLLVNLKFKMQHWRLGVFTKIRDAVVAGLAASEGKMAFEILSLIDLKPGAADLQLLAQAVAKIGDSALAREAAHYFALINEHALLREVLPQTSADLLKLAGPETKLPIIANAASRCTTEKWSGMPEFSEYFFEGNSVRYRGILFRSGDLLLCNVNRDGNGVFTFLNEPRAYAYHLGVFAILEQNGRKFPVVMESYIHGVRPVPLSSFLTPKFNSYLEVFRLKQAPADFAERINRVAAILESTVKGYNFDTEDPDHDYLACTTVGRHIFQLAGVEPVKTKSWYCQDPQVQRNLVHVDFVLPAFLSPSDYLVDENLEFVGAADNNDFHRNVSRELCERHFLKILHRYSMNISHLPIIVHISRWAIRTIRTGSLLGRVLGAPLGFTPVNLPKGPEKVLAVIEHYEHLLKAAVRRGVDPIRAHWDSNQLIDIDKLVSNPEMEQVLDEQMSPIIKTCDPLETSATLAADAGE